MSTSDIKWNNISPFINHAQRSIKTVVFFFTLMLMCVNLIYGRKILLRRYEITELFR